MEDVGFDPQALGRDSHFSEEFQKIDKLSNISSHRVRIKPHASQELLCTASFDEKTIGCTCGHAGSKRACDSIFACSFWKGQHWWLIGLGWNRNKGGLGNFNELCSYAWGAVLWRGPRSHAVRIEFFYAPKVYMFGVLTFISWSGFLFPKKSNGGFGRPSSN